MSVPLLNNKGNFYLKAFLCILILTLLLGTIHNTLAVNSGFSIIKMYAFIGIATFLSASALKFAHSVAANQIALVYLATMFVKFGAAVLLFPELIDDSIKLSRVQLLHFLVPYFLFLALEAIIVIRWLNEKE